MLPPRHSAVFTCTAWEQLRITLSWNLMFLIPPDISEPKASAAWPGALRRHLEMDTEWDGRLTSRPWWSWRQQTNCVWIRLPLIDLCGQGNKQTGAANSWICLCLRWCSFCLTQPDLIAIQSSALSIWHPLTTTSDDESITRPSVLGPDLLEIWTSRMFTFEQ